MLDGSVRFAKPVEGAVDSPGTPSNSNVPHLKVVGNKIVTDDSRQINMGPILRGMNFGEVDWQWNQGYDHAISYDLRYTEEMQAWGGRIAVLGTAHGPVLANDVNYLRYLDFHVAKAQEFRRYVMFVPRVPTINGDPFDRYPNQQQRDYLVKLATRYKGNPHVLFATMVEPHHTTDPTPSVQQAHWDNTLAPHWRTTIDLVHAATAPFKPIIMVAGDAYGRWINGAITNPILKDNVVYKAHVYIKQFNGAYSFSSYFGQAVDAGLPVFFGETGPEADQGVTQQDAVDAYNYAETHGIGWAAWAAVQAGEPWLYTILNDPPRPWTRTYPTIYPHGEWGEETKRRLSVVPAVPPPII